LHQRGFFSLFCLLASCAPTPILGPCPICAETGLTPSFCEDGLSPSAVLKPTPGELYYTQLGLPGHSLGESAIVVGPGGSVILIDVGNDAHTKEVTKAIEELRQQMNEAGFTARPDAQVDHIILTHLHADHIGGIKKLLEKISVSGLIIHRGLFDLTEAANLKETEELCLALENQSSFALCEGESIAPCDSSQWNQEFPATSCSGLNKGDLLIEGDDGVSFLSLGATARLSFLAVDGFIGTHQFEAEVEPFLRDDSNGENARSLVGIIEQGNFRLLFSGDLTGGGDETNPVEGFYIEHLEEVFSLGLSGVDVLHAGHHGRDTSSSASWVQALLPSDGTPRNAIAAISGGHINSPQEDAVTLLADAVGGGFLWVTQVALFGENNEKIQDADGGNISLLTFDQGRSYVIQRLDRKGRLLESRGFVSAQCE
jgi:beta-lactamase superfamily II metal-dependent hydrolase